MKIHMHFDLVWHKWKICFAEVHNHIAIFVKSIDNAESDFDQLSKPHFLLTYNRISPAICWSSSVSAGSAKHNGRSCLVWNDKSSQQDYHGNVLGEKFVMILKKDLY